MTMDLWSKCDGEFSGSGEGLGGCPPGLQLLHKLPVSRAVAAHLEHTDTYATGPGEPTLEKWETMNWSSIDSAAEADYFI